MQYGHFDDNARNYVIDSPAPPSPWISYPGTDDFFSLISSTAGGCCLFKDAKLRRITRCRYNNVPADTGSKNYCISRMGPQESARPAETWSPTFLPSATRLDSHRCRHRLDYSIFKGGLHGIEATLTAFAPPHAWTEINKLDITNRTCADQIIDVTGCVEWWLWNAVDASTSFQRNLPSGEVEVETNADNMLPHHRTEYKERRNHHAFYPVNHRTAGCDTDRSEFLVPLNGWDHPSEVKEGHAHDASAHGWSPIAANRVRLGLTPGQTQTLIFMTGYAENEPDDKRQGNAETGRGFNDDPLCLVASAYAYLAETADISILNEPVPSNNEECMQALLLEHLRLSVNFTLEHRGLHHLPLIGRADWNDCLNLSCFSSKTGKKLPDRGEQRHRRRRIDFHRGNVHALCRAIFGHPRTLWTEVRRRHGQGSRREGRGCPHEAGGEKLGTGNGQTAKTLTSVKERPTGEWGTAILAPAYSTCHIELGEISTYPAGYKKNGGIFCHNNPWVSIANAMIGNDEEAFTIYRRTCPAYVEGGSDIRQAESYAYRQMAAGLKIEPHLPRALSHVSVRRMYRGRAYDTTLTRAGRRSLVPDGCAVSGNVVAAADNSQEIIHVTATFQPVCGALARKDLPWNTFIDTSREPTAHRRSCSAMSSTTARRSTWTGHGPPF